ncbi:MAG TPA: sensor domain-containing diguanylate cyclase [Nitrospirota bacterium]
MKNDIFYKKLLDSLYDGVYFVDPNRVITYWNKGAERITGYEAAEVIGKRCSDNILMHSDKDGNLLCLKACPLSQTIADGKVRNQDVFLRHKDGHRVPVGVRVTHIVDNAGVIIGGVEIFSDNAPPVNALERLAELERLAFLDPLTGIANRRYGEISLNARIEELQRYGWRFGVLFIDIDHFKQCNDQCGHHVGDEVLKMVAKTLQNSVRSFDVVSRWGGEEFVALIANVEGDELIRTANRCRALVEQSHSPVPPCPRITVSIGGTLARAEDTAASIITRADGLMYKSKQSGRNRVTME